MSDEREKLFTEERQSEILKLLRQKHKLLVPELSERFGVSAATIRSDLNEMEHKGLLKRTHGGALLISKSTFEQNISERLVHNRRQKEQIAALAATLVEDGDTIALDTGTTTLALAEQLVGKKHLTVVTNDLLIAALLEEQSDATVILLGGTVRRGYHCTLGPMAVAGMKNLGVDKSILGANGFTAKRGITTPDPQQAEVKRQLASIGTEVILLCDDSKIGTDSFVSVLPASAVDRLVTNALPDDLQAGELSEAGVEILVP